MFVLLADYNYSLRYALLTFQIDDGHACFLVSVIETCVFLLVDTKINGSAHMTLYLHNYSAQINIRCIYVVCTSRWSLIYLVCKLSSNIRVVPLCRSKDVPLSPPSFRHFKCISTNATNISIYQIKGKILS